MKLKTTILLLISVLIVGLTVLAASFWEAMGMGAEESPILAFALMISFGLNVAGIIFAFIERKENKRMSRIALFGHVLLVFVFLAISGYALMTLE